MPKLSLLIADSEESYARGLSGYINANHSTAYQADYFTRAESFIDYMMQHPEADVLLIGPDFYDIAKGYDNFRLKVILTKGILDKEYSDFKAIYKYNTAEKLISELAHLYCESNPSEVILPLHGGDTKFIGIYSPAGGVGKSTIAASLSKQCKESGMCSFYLNLESIQSTEAFFSLDGKRSLSYIFYYLKEESSNLSFKMEGVKSTEAGNGVDFFNPPESPMEYEEINSDELKKLLDGIKGMGRYAYVFIDMPSVFDKKNHTIMRICDYVILVELQEPISLHKNRIFHHELAKLCEADKTNISDKLITVMNKCRDRRAEAVDAPVGGVSYAVRIPEYTRTLIREDGRVDTDDEGFRDAIDQLIRIISGR